MQALDGALHGEHGGVEDIQFVDLFDFGPGDMPAQGFFTDLVEEFFTTRFGEFFHVVETEDRTVRVKNHRRRDHRATERAAPDFIHAGHQFMGLRDQAEIQPHLRRHRASCLWPIKVNTASAAWFDASRRKVRWMASKPRVCSSPPSIKGSSVCARASGVASSCNNSGTTRRWASRLGKEM